ncbi:AVAST type 2 anti-phage system protein Avs2 [Thalassoglobus sp.]|uniref:AVAST type 2 anti-phage system protein Avs2 n=1 Tax=Thalassoglobus sp. TaxID=2795869 RepID=UPI003AA7CBEF
MSINWADLRPLNGDLQKSFEEFCCQLAYAEHEGTKYVFTRKGTPDGGVECFWKTNTGEEWGWQAKYFRQTIGASQWSQIRESFNTAFKTHPDMTRYIICIPQNLPDSRQTKTKSAAKKWEELKNELEKQSLSSGRAVKIELWDESAITSRIQDQKFQGMLWFWFASQQSFTQEWYSDRLSEAIANAGDRYTPQIHVDLPQADLFDGLSRHTRFFCRIRELVGKLHRVNKKISTNFPHSKFEADHSVLMGRLTELFTLIAPVIHGCDQNNISFSRILTPIPVDELGHSIESIRTELDVLFSNLDSFRKVVNDNPTEAEKSNYYRSERIEELNSAHRRLRELQIALYEIDTFLVSDETKLATNPALILKGEAGEGKTHLLCDVAEKSIGEGLPQILLHGSHFQDAEPWGQIVELLGLTCSVDEFLGAVQASAMANECRIVLFIDAINEGTGNSLWKKHLPGMLKRLSRYPWIGICLSIRSSYFKLIVPDYLSEPDVICAKHRGFHDNESRAMETFFSHYGITPSFPMLAPEFSNPLFLKSFCVALKNKNLTHVPLGMRGISQLLDHFIDSINEKLAAPEMLDFNPNDQIVQKALDSLCKEFAFSDKEYLNRQEAESIVNYHLPSNSNSKSLFQHLVHEGILNVDCWRIDTDHIEVAHLAYQRFTDHLVAQHLLDRCSNDEATQLAFEAQGEIGKRLTNEISAWEHSGLIEALSVQVPERIGSELFEMIPHLAECDVIREAFVKSLSWRKGDSFSTNTFGYIQEVVLRWPGTYDDFWDSVLMTAPMIDHALNARWLDQKLFPLSLSDRDEWWSVFLNENSFDESSSNRLVDWAWSDLSKYDLNDEVVFLTGLTLVWFFTSSNCVLRDRATKALVNLLQDRMSSLQQLLTHFAEVNDPYVSERIYAVAYGCAMRSLETDQVDELALTVYKLVFEQENPPVHLRTRDYARGVIEKAYSLNPQLPVDIDKVRPPYKSKWPNKVPIKEATSARRMTFKGSDKSNQAVEMIVSSVTSSFDDFCKYRIEELRDWSNVKFGETSPPTRKEVAEAFEESLTDRQKDAFEKIKLVKAYNKQPSRVAEILEQEVSEEQFKRFHDTVESDFRKTLRRGSKKAKIYQQIVAGYLDHPYGDERGFDLDFAKRWILQRVCELGWNVEKFGKHDLSVQRSSYYPNSGVGVERIGMKYQWIAYFELAARIADNFQMKGRYSTFSDDALQYEGPWQLIGGRDVDPSTLCTKTERDNWVSSSWWFTDSQSIDWEEQDHANWLAAKSDLPEPKELIQVVRHSDETQWLNLNGHYRWEEPTPLEEDRFDCIRRTLDIWVDGYLVRKRDSKKLLNWVRKQHLYGGLMRDNNSEYRIFLGEFFWSPMFKSCDNEYYGRDGWTTGDFRTLPCEILKTNESFMRESGSSDHSIRDTVLMELPSKELFEGMQLSWSGNASEFMDGSGTVVIFDPSVLEKGPASLLVRRDKFLDFLHKEDLDVVWIVTGEKMRVGGSLSQKEYLGHMEIGGYYYFDSEVLTGSLKPKFKSPEG